MIVGEEREKLCISLRARRAEKRRQEWRKRGEKWEEDRIQRSKCESKGEGRESEQSTNILEESTFPVWERIMNSVAVGYGRPTCCVAASAASRKPCSWRVLKREACRN